MNRIHIINKLIWSNNYSSYLEIGVRRGRTFGQIICARKVGVDPFPKNFKVTFKMKSDDFFMQNIDKFDIVFIDGDHTEKQVDKDIQNSLNCLNENGTIVLHDCNPIAESMQSEDKPAGPWNGTVWKSIVKIRSTRKDLFVATINCDHGCAIIRRGTQDLITIPESLTYADLDKNRVEWLNLVDEKLADNILLK